MRQFFYWCYNPVTKFTKFGITDNFDRRRTQIENGCGCQIIPICVLLCDYADKAESLVLSVLSKHKTKGEWFDLDIDHVEFQWLGTFFQSIATILDNDESAIYLENISTSYYTTSYTGEI